MLGAEQDMCLHTGNVALYTRIEGDFEEIDGWSVIKNCQSVTKLLLLVESLSHGQDETDVAIYCHCCRRQNVRQSVTIAGSLSGSCVYIWIAVLGFK